MKKKPIAILLTAVLLASLFLSCSPQKETHGDGSVNQETVASSGESTPSHSDFAGKDIAAIVGATHYMTIEKIGGNPIYYNDSPEAAEEVRRGTVSGFMTILSNARVMASQLNGFEVIPVPKEVFNSQTGGISDDQAVIDRFNVFLASIKADGTFADMEARWFSDEIDLNAPMPKIDNSGKNGVLRVATSALSMPYVYYGENGELKGFSAELALRFGAYEEKKVEFEDSGTAYDPLSGETPDISLSAEEREIGGLGLFMVKNMMDSVTYRRDGNKNILTITKRVV